MQLRVAPAPGAGQVLPNPYATAATHPARTHLQNECLNACSNTCRAGLSEEEVAAAILERAEARAAKDYAASDAVRARLEAVGILIMDTPEGTTWKPGPRLHIAEEGQ